MLASQVPFFLAQGFPAENSLRSVSEAVLTDKSVHGVTIYLGTSGSRLRPIVWTYLFKILYDHYSTLLVLHFVQVLLS